MKYEQKVTVASNGNAKSRRYCKKEKSKANRLANKRITMLYQVGLDERAEKISPDQCKGWEH